MKKILMTSLLVFFTSIGHASIGTDSIGNAGWSDLTDAQQAEILKAVADKVVNNQQEEQKKKQEQQTQKQEELVDPKKMDDWVSLGEHIGLAFGGAAKELNIAVNDFITTPVGMMAMVLIVWNFIGQTILHIFGSLIILIVGFGFLRWHKRSMVDTKREYDPERKDWFGRSLLVSEEQDAISDGWKFTYWLSALIIIVGSSAVLFAA